MPESIQSSTRGAFAMEITQVLKSPAPHLSPKSFICGIIHMLMLLVINSCLSMNVMEHLTDRYNHPLQANTEFFMKHLHVHKLI